VALADQGVSSRWSQGYSVLLGFDLFGHSDDHGLSFSPLILNKVNHRGHSAAEPQPKTFTTEGTEITEKMLKLQNQRNAENPPQNACQNFKALKASSTEPAEVKMAKSSRPENRGKKSPISDPSREAKNPKKLPEQALCILCEL
jgi:hypothetical protein